MAENDIARALNNLADAIRHAVDSGQLARRPEPTPHEPTHTKFRKVESFEDAEFRCVSTQQAAEISGIKAKTLYAWRSKGVGPPSFKRGGVVLFRLRDLLAWLDEGEASEERA